MRIDQVVIGAAVGDAVTEAARLTRDALRLAVPSELYAVHRDGRLSAEVQLLDRYPAATETSYDDVIVFHVSIGEAGIIDWLLHRPERVILVYHNITPAPFFRRLDPTFAHLLEDGRHQLRLLVDRADGLIADSEYNADELRALGRADVEVSPPPLRLDALYDVVPDAGLTETLARDFPGPMLLFVGQILPHKRPDFLVAAFHEYLTNVQPDATLVLCGPTRNYRYVQALRRYLDSLRIADRVWITSEVSHAQLAAFFRRADLFVSASEHEGFCVPIVEAFHFGVPVLARGFGAVPATTGDAGVVLSDTSGIADLAEAMGRLLSDDALLDELSDRGRARAQEFTTDATVARFLRALQRCLLEPRTERSAVLS
jgi:glycosyltransferase involved in cell wall biosynthesis